MAVVLPQQPHDSIDHVKPIPIATSWSADTLVNVSTGPYRRSLGDCELSYYLPSRQNGVNDMYLCIGFRAPEHLVQRERVRTVWAILRTRHSLLASKIEMHSYENVEFVYSPPSSPENALSDADQVLRYCTSSKDQLIDSYLNGPRTLSNDRLSYLMISQPDAAPASEPDAPKEFEFFFCASHFLGDGMALHLCANDFFSLLGSSKTQSQLDTILHDEWHARVEKLSDAAESLPSCLEDKLPPRQSGRFRQAAAQVDFKRTQEKLIGGHAFPKKSSALVHTVVPTVPFDAECTKKILKNCKAHGVSISSALFAVCNIAWARASSGRNKEFPTMMYTALNLRPYFTPRPSNDSYWFLAIGYFNVILPAFLPNSGDLSATMWHRARLAKEQSNYAAKNTMVVTRSREMSRLRAQNARQWAKADDDKERGVPKIATPPNSSQPLSPRPSAPSAVLIGLSLLGNLDGIYKHSTFPEIKLQTLTTGSRQRSGGMLLFAYTFAGQLWLSLGYDENGFDTEVVEKFWDGVLSGVEEFLSN